MNNDKLEILKLDVFGLPIGAGETIWYCWPLIEMVWTACDVPPATAEDTTPPEGLDAGEPSSAPSSSVVDT